MTIQDLLAVVSNVRAPGRDHQRVAKVIETIIIHLGTSVAMNLEKHLVVATDRLLHKGVTISLHKVDNLTDAIDRLYLDQESTTTQRSSPWKVLLSV